MNKTITNIAYLTYLSFSILVIILTLFGNLTFGHGLGDLRYIFIVAILIASVTILKVLGRKREELNWVVFFAAIGIMIFIVLKITVLRGPEYSWNGKLFL